MDPRHDFPESVLGMRVVLLHLERLAAGQRTKDQGFSIPLRDWWKTFVVLRIHGDISVTRDGG
jgi:hypothetical protein